ncbi:MAG: phage holin family protein [Niabella sp.]
MFEIKDKVQDVVEDVEEIAKDYYKLAMVNVVEKTSKLGAVLSIMAVTIALLFFIALFIGMALSYWIGQALGNPMWGFFIVAGGLLIILLLIFLLKKKVIQPFIRNIIIENLYD